MMPLHLTSWPPTPIVSMDHTSLAADIRLIPLLHFRQVSTVIFVTLDGSFPIFISDSH